MLAMDSLISYMMKFVCVQEKRIYVVFVASMMDLLRPGLSNLISIVLCAGKAMNAKSTLL